MINQSNENIENILRLIRRDPMMIERLSRFWKHSFVQMEE